MDKEKQVDLTKEVFNKSQYFNTIDTSFQEFGIKSIVEEIEEEVTIEEFFGHYNTLFYDIPAIGETDSHEFLIKTSSEYIKFEDNEIEIEALRLEISNLREELLNEQIKNLELTTGKKLPQQKIQESSTISNPTLDINDTISKIIG